MKDVSDMKKIASVIDRAIVVADRFVPPADRNPTVGGGKVRETAVGLLVAARAIMEAVIEEGAKDPKR